jgi:hypothetical protein
LAAETHSAWEAAAPALSLGPLANYPQTIDKEVITKRIG